MMILAIPFPLVLSNGCKEKINSVEVMIQVTSQFKVLYIQKLLQEFVIAIFENRTKMLDCMIIEI